MILDIPSQNIIKNGVEIGECDTCHYSPTFKCRIIEKNLEKLLLKQFPFKQHQIHLSIAKMSSSYSTVFCLDHCIRYQNLQHYVQFLFM